MKLFLSSLSNCVRPHKSKARMLVKLWAKLLFWQLLLAKRWRLNNELIIMQTYSIFSIHHISMKPNSSVITLFYRVSILFILFRALKQDQISAWISYAICIFVNVNHFLLTKLFMVFQRLALFSWLIPDHQQTVCMV